MKDDKARLNTPWAITPDALKDIAVYDAEKCELSPRLEAFSASDFEEKIEFESESGLATIRIHGPVMVNPELWERFFYNAVDLVRVEELLREAESNDSIKAVLLDINSPGGTVTGTPEVGNAVADLAKKKPVYAFTNSLMASAAYWIGSQATKIYATESARVGSIGVIRPHIDASEAYKRTGLKVELFTAGKFKAAGAYATALTDEQREHIQEEVDKLGVEFRSTVKSARPDVSAETMEGQVLYGKEALTASLIDCVAPNSATVLKMARAAAEVGVNAQVDTLTETNSDTMANDTETEKPDSAEEVEETPEAVDAPEAAESNDAAENSEDASEAAESNDAAENSEDAPDESEESESEEDESDDSEDSDEDDSEGSEELDASIPAEAVEAAANLTKVFEANAELMKQNAALRARVDALEANQTSTEQKAAEIASQSGTEPLEVTPDGDGASDNSAFAKMSVEQLWAHCETIKGKDSNETSAKRHEFYVAHIKPRQGRF